MLFRCKNCNKPVEVDFYYHTDLHSGKFTEMFDDAISRATEECDCNKNKK